MAQDQRQADAIERWNEMQTPPVPPLVVDGRVFIDNRAEYDPGVMDAAVAEANAQRQQMSAGHP
ncbi:hypothetical protein [Aquabacterium sp.]|uniref:hypothetical protein n=1 Tax=Aquabacterium sp. TaxID=1872578 RepID=UPI0035B05BDC